MSAKKPKKKHLFWSLGLVMLGVVAFLLLTFSRPPMARKESQPSYPPVRVVPVVMEQQQLSVPGEGTVQPLREITLASQVAGQVIKVDPSLVSGGSFVKGQTLLWIDPADYKLALTQAQAKVREAETSLQLAREEARAAQQEWQQLRRKDDQEQPPPLVAKEPQLAAAQALLEAARANLAEARLHLKRTTLTAPFEGRVSKKVVDLGQYLRLGEAVATIYSTEEAEIVVHLESSDLAWLKVPGLTSDQPLGSPAVVKVDFAGREHTWQGVVVRSEGKVDERTRLVPLVVRVARPYDRKPPLAAGLFARVEIQGSRFGAAALLPRAALRQGDLAWVVDPQGHLRFRQIKVVRVQGDQVLINDGLKAGEQVVISPLGTATDGMRVRPVPADEEAGS